MNARNLSAVLALLLSWSGEAVASDKVITVPANRTSGIAEFSAYTPDCHLIGKPTMSVPTKPAHGSVTFAWVASRLGNNAGFCKGKPGHMMRVLYTPAKGYHGPDQFKVGMSFPAFENGSGASSYDAEEVHVVVR